MIRPVYRWMTSGVHQEPTFPGSSAYWEGRYVNGGNSGVGSYGKFAEFKAEVINAFVAKNDIQSVIEFGCGDGSQLKLARYPRYAGFDVSESAIKKCKETFSSDPTKTFDLVDRYGGQAADLAMSLDVIYHLVEDDVFEKYMRTLFDAGDRFVIIYSSDVDYSQPEKHVKHRKFSRWVQQFHPDFRLREHILNRYPFRGDATEGSFADFFIYERI
jgi:cyclopropane fatty-acyl-phospholipid synthase-like methyltransferase